MRKYRLGGTITITLLAAAFHLLVTGSPAVAACFTYPVTDAAGNITYSELCGLTVEEFNEGLRASEERTAAKRAEEKEADKSSRDAEKATEAQRLADEKRAAEESREEAAAARRAELQTRTDDQNAALRMLQVGAAAGGLANASAREDALDPTLRLEIGLPSGKWLLADGHENFLGGTVHVNRAAGQLEGMAGGVIGITLLSCTALLVVGVLGWAAARGGSGMFSKDQAAWTSRAGHALLAAALLGAIGAAVAWGADLFGVMRM